MKFLGWDGVRSTEDLEMVGVYFVYRTNRARTWEGSEHGVSRMGREPITGDWTSMQHFYKVRMEYPG